MIDGIEVVAPEPLRWFLVEKSAGVFCWSQLKDLATRFTVSRAEEIHAVRSTLPFLPSGVPPLFVRVHHGLPVDGVPDLPVATRAPELAEERKRRVRHRIDQLEASVRHVEPADSYRAACERLGERD